MAWAIWTARKYINWGAYHAIQLPKGVISEGWESPHPRQVPSSLTDLWAQPQALIFKFSKSEKAALPGKGKPLVIYTLVRTK